MKRPGRRRAAPSTSAICAVASAVRKRAAARAPDGWPAWPLSVETRSGRVLCSAGKSPKSTPVAERQRRRRTSSTGGSSASGRVAGGLGRQERPMIASSVHRATSRPAEAAEHREQAATRSAAARRAASGWRRSRGAPPSRRRAPAARASSRLAMLAQAMSSTSAGDAEQQDRAACAPRRGRELWPRAPGLDAELLGLEPRHRLRRSCPPAAAPRRR